MTDIHLKFLLNRKKKKQQQRINNKKQKRDTEKWEIKMIAPSGYRTPPPLPRPKSEEKKIRFKDKCANHFSNEPNDNLKQNITAINENLRAYVMSLTLSKISKFPCGSGLSFDNTRCVSVKSYELKP